MKKYLGIDIGSMYIGAVMMDENKEIIETMYMKHNGNYDKTLDKIFKKMDAENINGLATTGSGGYYLSNYAEVYPSEASLIEGAKYFMPEVRNIIYIGASSYILIKLNEHGEFYNQISNSACASGTGAFLDQQATRLNFSPEELGEKALIAERAPSVATRCAVFAKSDMIHLQQEGYLKEEIAAGLCKSMGHATINALLKGQTLKFHTLFIGGVALNRAVENAVDDAISVKLKRIDKPHLVGATGTALLSFKKSLRNKLIINEFKGVKAKSDKGVRPILELKYSDYPDFDFHKFYVDDNMTEVSIVENISNLCFHAKMGIDIGSTSTKAVLMTDDLKIKIILYRKTMGEPIKAVQYIFSAIKNLTEKYNIDIRITGVGTTGSGRKLIKKVIHADLEMNEITAHARAALFIDPDVDTIIEIGGQDSKFTQLKNGIVYNSVMNYVCAAGTGSFIEEQAKKLGIDINDYADFVLGKNGPFTSDRCTVFMERDIDLLLARGYNKRELAASVLYSIRDNYITRVINGLNIGEKVYFQGATARNKALIAAFEEEVKKPILVSKFCHVTGAMGLCLLLYDKGINKTNFVGFDFADKHIHTDFEVCELCVNKCQITLIKSETETIGWGYKCGREQDDNKMKVSDNIDYKFFRERNRLFNTIAGIKPKKINYRIGFPRSLLFHSFYPMWKSFFNSLNIELVLSDPSNDKIFEEGHATITAEYCAPVVISHGHIDNLIKKQPDYFFLPYSIRNKKDHGMFESFFCPYVQSHPSVLKSVKILEPIYDRIIAPIIQFNYSDNYNIKSLNNTLGKKLNIPKKEIKRAYIKSRALFNEFNNKLLDLGKEALNEIERTGKQGIVILGRHYNIYDKRLSLNLPEKIAEKGVLVIPIDLLPFDGSNLSNEWRNMYWYYGQKIISVSNYIAKNDNLFGIFFTSFSCGPDSYIIPYFKDIMLDNKKPYLILQFDGHGADAGYMTRIEAALESFSSWHTNKVKNKRFFIKRSNYLKDKTILIPPMEPVGVHFFAAALRAYGYDARPMEENAEAYKIGMKYLSGNECIPYPMILGDIFYNVEKMNLDPNKCAFFIPTASGPCRLGQYVRLYDIIMAKKGWTNASFFAPSAVDGYKGVPVEAYKRLWLSLLITEIFKKLELRLRPYEKIKGSLNETKLRMRDFMTAEFEKKNWNLEKALRHVLSEYEKIELLNIKKPKIGIVGEIYVRNTTQINGNLINFIEREGGEVMITSIIEWLVYRQVLNKMFAMDDGIKPVEIIKAAITRMFFHRTEKKYFGMAEYLIGDRMEPGVDEIIDAGMNYVPKEFNGEVILNVGRARLFITKNNVDAVVNVSPNFCMFGTISSSIFGKMEREFGIPIVNIFYDGTGDPNTILKTHMHYLREKNNF